MWKDLKKPETKANFGCEFLGWFYDDTHKINDDTKIMGDCTITAKFDRNLSLTRTVNFNFTKGIKEKDCGKLDTTTKNIWIGYQTFNDFINNDCLPKCNIYSGWKFDAWYHDENATDEVDGEDIINESDTLFIRLIEDYDDNTKTITEEEYIQKKSEYIDLLLLFL